METIHGFRRVHRGVILSEAKDLLFAVILRNLRMKRILFLRVLCGEKKQC